MRIAQNPSPDRHDGVPAVVLAAGKGTRMKREEPKAAVAVNGRPMAVRVIDALRQAGVGRVVAVVGHRAADVCAAIGDGIEYAIQDEQLGTGHAVMCAAPVLSGLAGPVLVAYADIPLLRACDVKQLLERHVSVGAAATLLTARFREPGTLGRIVRGPGGEVRGIVEARDASAEQLEIQEINVGVYCFDAPLLLELLGTLTSDNAQKQYYLTDVIGALVKRGKRVEGVVMDYASAGIGVDTVEDLARAEGISGASEHHP